jgi:hypothetical protein
MQHRVGERAEEVFRARAEGDVDRRMSTAAGQEEQTAEDQDDRGGPGEATVRRR